MVQIVGIPGRLIAQELHLSGAAAGKCTRARRSNSMSAPGVFLAAGPAGLPAWQVIFLLVFALVAGLITALMYYRRSATPEQWPQFGYWRNVWPRRHPFVYGAVLGISTFVIVLTYVKSILWALIVGALAGVAGFAGRFIAGRREPS